MKKVLYFMLFVFLTACGGGGGGYTPSCVNSEEGCTKHVPTSGRGNSSNYIPSTDRGETTPEPSDDRGNNSNLEPTEEERGDNVNYTPSSNRGNDAENIVNSERGSRPSRENRQAVLQTKKLGKKIDYVSIGKDLGLSYSDFGSYKIENDAFVNFAGIENDVFINGDDTKRIDAINIEKDVVFSGRAIGNASKGSEFVKLDGNVRLNFDNVTGVSTLDATFENWYDIFVKDDAAGTIEFSNYKNKDNIVKFKEDNSLEKIVNHGANMVIKYYGQDPEKSIPTEAVGSVKFKEDLSNIKMDIAFGVK